MGIRARRDGCRELRQAVAELGFARREPTPARARVRLVKSQREMEGRFEDVWVLVDPDDDLETWDESAELDVVGRPATRADGLLRTSGSARYTVDVALPGMLHARVLRAPVARCRVTRLDLEAARATPGFARCSARAARSR